MNKQLMAGQTVLLASLLWCGAASAAPLAAGLTSTLTQTALSSPSLALAPAPMAGLPLSLPSLVVPGAAALPGLSLQASTNSIRPIRVPGVGTITLPLPTLTFPTPGGNNP
jgi:hypothetical protein